MALPTWKPDSTHFSIDPHKRYNFRTRRAPRWGDPYTHRDQRRRRMASAFPKPRLVVLVLFLYYQLDSQAIGK